MFVDLILNVVAEIPDEFRDGLFECYRGVETIPLDIILPNRPTLTIQARVDSITLVDEDEYDTLDELWSVKLREIEKLRDSRRVAV